MSRDIPEDADFLCDKADRFRDMIKETFCIVDLSTSRFNCTKNSEFFHTVYLCVLFLRIGSESFLNTAKLFVSPKRREF